MKQITQTLKTGVVEVNEVPIPTLTDKFVLVRNSASVISAGTEKTKIDMGKKNLVQKAMARPDLVRQVLKKLQSEGLSKTLQTVNTRLSSPSPLGYSCAGTVVAAGGLVEGIQPGDRVACGGANYANHAEFVAVPRNLLVKVPAAVSDEEAAFATVGAIALQGVRLAGPQLGETFLVLGLGLLGQIATQLLRANGCNVIVNDLDAAQVARAVGFGAVGIGPGMDLQGACLQLTGGHGVDGVLVCAGTASNQPIEACGAVTRAKGRVVVVGAVRMDIPREDYFKKEISVVISRSYGPGRYDPDYEENGNDYPLAYVRFTEQRNMQTFIELVAQGKIDVKSMITHRYPVSEAAAAYRLIEGEKTEPYLGIVLQYAPASAEVPPPRIATVRGAVRSGGIGLSFFGAGNYATATLLPVLKQMEQVGLRGLATASGRTAQGVAAQFGFQFCAGGMDELLADDTDVLVVTTRHDSHAAAAVAALSAGKHVYVEKPLALTVESLAQVQRAYVAWPGSQLMVGFNRRFAPATVVVREHFQAVQSPLVVSIRVNAGAIPAGHWIQDPAVGGGRVIGEACHFIDLASAIVGANPRTVSCVGTAKSHVSAMVNDNVVISLGFEGGSVASIVYVADGAKALYKERVEVFGGERSAVIEDFREVELFAGEQKVRSHKYAAQDKGQRAMLEHWIRGLGTGRPCVAHDCLMASSLATVLAVESLALGAPLVVDLALLTAGGGEA